MVQSPGEAFTFSFDGNHMWVALTKPTGKNGTFLAVNLTSVKAENPIDDTCIIQPGEHPWVRKQTEVYYMKAREWQVSGFDGLASYGGNCEKQKPVSKELLKRIQEGALVSPHMKERFADMVREELGS